MLFRLLDWFKNYRLSMIEAQMKADNRQFELIRDMAQSNTEIVKVWLDSFKVTEIPSTTVMRDEDEYVAEQNSLHPAIAGSMENAIRAGAFPELQDMIKESLGR